MGSREGSLAILQAVRLPNCLPVVCCARPRPAAASGTLSQCLPNLGSFAVALALEAPTACVKQLTRMTPACLLQARVADSDGGSSDESGGEDAGGCRALARLPAPGTTASALALPAAAPRQLNSQTAADLVRNLLSLPFDRRAELCCDILVRHEPSRQTVEGWALAQAGQHPGGCEDMEMRCERGGGGCLKGG